MIALGLALFLQISPLGFKEPVKITSEQAPLLRSEARAVLTRTIAAREELQAVEAKKGFEVSRQLLRAKVSETNAAVSRVNDLFMRMSPGPSQKYAAEIFFGDISRGYERVLDSIADLNPQKYAPVRKSAFQAFERNALAYLVVADDGSLTFDLDTRSNPQGGAVSYKRTGDPYQAHPDPTDTVIHNLAYAIWTVRVQKQGYKDQDKSHDPFREKNHVLVFILEKP